MKVQYDRRGEVDSWCVICGKHDSCKFKSNRVTFCSQFDIHRTENPDNQLKLFEQER